MKTLILLVLFTMSTILPGITQKEKQFPVSISMFNNGTLLPGMGKAGFITLPIHPGLAVGTEYVYKSSDKNRLYQTFKLGYFYHRLAQHGIQLYSEFSYRQCFSFGLGIGPKAGIGYLHSIPDLNQYKLNDEGEYEKTGFGRAQLLGSFALEFYYDFKTLPVDLFLDYQFWVQAPFVKGYVPVLPNTSLQLGVLLPLYLSKKQ